MLTQEISPCVNPGGIPCIYTLVHNTGTLISGISFWQYGINYSSWHSELNPNRFTLVRKLLLGMVVCDVDGVWYKIYRRFREIRYARKRVNGTGTAYTCNIFVGPGSGGHFLIDFSMVPAMRAARNDTALYTGWISTTLHPSSPSRWNYAFFRTPIYEKRERVRRNCIQYKTIII